MKIKNALKKIYCFLKFHKFFLKKIIFPFVNILNNLIAILN